MAQTLGLCELGDMINDWQLVWLIANIWSNIKTILHILYTEY